MKIIMNVLLLSAFLFAFDASSFADQVTIKAIVPKPVVGVPKTGQTIPYATGDDAWYVVNGDKGVPETGVAHYTDNGNGTITDNATGLMWVKDVYQISGWGPIGSPTYRTWLQAIDACETLNYAGHDDWRLPNIKELQSLVDYSTYYGSNAGGVPSDFIILYHTPLWTSTTLVSTTRPGNAWCVAFGCDINFVPIPTGYSVTFSDTGNVTRNAAKSSTNLVLPVRGPD